MSDVDLGQSYRTIRKRLTDLANELSEAELEMMVPGCPQWRVRDIFAHLTGATADVMAGNLEGAPGEAWTRRQVADRRDRPIGDVLAEWAAIAPEAEQALTERRLPLQSVADIATHEHDIRGALNRPGYRDDDIVRWVAGWALSTMGKKVIAAGLPALRVRTDSGERTLGHGEPAVTLDTTDFEVMRAVLGRRSRAQIAAMAWAGDASPYLEHLSVFPPSELDIVE
jgi:uncharacterized protein (TIGR03083 family)